MGDVFDTVTVSAWPEIANNSINATVMEQHCPKPLLVIIVAVTQS
jgi:hypothetical protein